MTKRIDHAAESLVWLEHANDEYEREPHHHDNVVEYLAQAQVHATLALVEQQRIANLLNLAQFQSAVDEGRRLITSVENAADLRLMVTTALGLEPDPS